VGAASPLGIRAASESDIPELASLLTEAARLLEQREGEAAWPTPYPADEIRESVRRGETYAVEFEGTIVGTLRLMWEDLHFWGPRPPDAGYVHKLATRRRVAHRDVARATLEWAAERVRSEGRAYVRLDCLAANAYLTQFYGSCGFEKVGTLRTGPPGHEHLYALLERSLAARPPARVVPS
jgi:GNAT superfamily N-acetyltransferase